MTAPNVTLTVKDGGLGIVPPSADGIHVKMGVASGLTALTLASFGSLAALQASGAIGPAVDAAAVTLNTVTNGVAPPSVLIFPVTPSTAATSSSVTTTRTSTSTGTVATTGSSPLDSYQVRIVIVTTGTLGAGTFKYSLDGGDTYSAEITIPGGGTYAITGSGVVAVFTAGGGPIFFEAGDLFVWTTTAPAMTTGDIATAITALLLLTDPWEGIHVVGAPADASATAALFAALATHAATIEASKRYRWIFMEAADTTDANLIAAMAASANSRVLVGAGWQEQYLPITKLTQKRPSAWPIIGRGMSIPVHEDCARVASGPLTGIVPNAQAPNGGLYRNEDLTPGMDSARFSTLRQFVNNDPAGIYVTNARMFSLPTSDFQFWQHRRVMDKACGAARSLLLQLLSDDVLVETSGARKGKILESEAAQIESELTARLRAVMSAHVSDIQAQLSRDDVILTTNTITVTITIIPKGYFKQIVASITYYNPALQPGS